MHFALKERKLTIPLRLVITPAANEAGSGVEISFNWQAPNGYRVVVQTGSSDISWHESANGPWQMIDDRTKIEFVDWSQRYRYSKESGVSVESESPSSLSSSACGSGRPGPWILCRSRCDFQRNFECNFEQSRHYQCSNRPHRYQSCTWFRRHTIAIATDRDADGAGLASRSVGYRLVEGSRMYRPRHQWRRPRRYVAAD